MPYSSVDEVPDYVPKDKRKQWMEVWNSSYKEHGDEERAFREANAVAGPHSGKKLLKAELYQDNGVYDETAEAGIRANITLWGDYAEGGPTYDPNGDYLCGSCAMRADKQYCTHVVGPINFGTGSCRIYEIGPSSGTPLPQKLTQIEVAYTERPTVRGFGCKRCEFGDTALVPDSIGRKLWCSFWGCHVMENACCFKNTGDDDVFAPVRGDKDQTEKSGGEAMPQVKKSDTFDTPLIFARMVKVDAAKREVWGVVTCELPDRDDEICDFDTTAPYFQAIVDEMKKASEVNPEGGVNIFPLRAMHGLIAAGKGIGIEFRKEAKEIYMGFKVVDDNEWKKVAENVYTGFSQGGRYVKRWKDGEYTRYTAKPGEVSLVDIPCLQAAHFDQVKVMKSLGDKGYDFIKEDGTTEVRKFALEKEAAIPTAEGAIPTTPTPISDVPSGPTTTCTCDCANCKAGSCSTCTMSEGCPCAGKAAKASKCACKCAGCSKGMHAECSADEKCQMCMAGKTQKKERGSLMKMSEQLRAKVTKRHNKYTEIIKAIIEERIDQRAYGQLGKGMYTVSEFAGVIDHLGWLLMSIEIEEMMEGEENETQEESAVLGEIKEILSRLLDAMLAYTEAQVDEAKEYLSA